LYLDIPIADPVSRVKFQGAHWRRLPKSKIGNLKSKIANAPLAQLAEQVTLNHWVAGSIPARCTTFGFPALPPGDKCPKKTND
jgi:hypothetical protein